MTCASPYPDFHSPSINEFILSPRKRSELASPRDFEQSPHIQLDDQTSNNLASPKSLTNDALSPRLSLNNTSVLSDDNASIEPKSCSSVTHESSNVDLDVAGEKKSNPKKRKKSEIEFEHIKDTSALTMKDIVLMIPRSKPPKPKSDTSILSEKSDDKTEKNGSTDPLDENQKEDTIALKKARALEPSFAIDADGNIVINPLDNKITVEDLIENSKKNSKMIFEDELANMTSSVHAYRKNPIERAKAWSTAETFTFYRALSTFGQDFSLIQHLFTDRSYNQIKRKFRLEERKNPHIINNILRNPKSYDLTAFFLDENEEEEEVANQTLKSRKKLPVSGGPKKKPSIKAKKEVLDPDEAEDETKKTPSRRSIRHLRNTIPSPKSLADTISAKQK